MFYSTKIEIETDEREVRDITDSIKSAVSESGVEEGFCLVFSPHTTAGLTINEEERGLKEDLLEKFERLVPAMNEYRHNRGAEDNAHSHIKDVLAGPDHTIPVEGGELALGTWQSVLFIETDGPRRRTVKLSLLGE